MEKVTELLTSHSINIEDLKIHDYKDALHIITSENKLLVFPTQELFIKTLNELVIKEENNKYKDLVAKALKADKKAIIKLIPNTPILETTMILNLSDTKDNYWYILKK